MSDLMQLMTDLGVHCGMSVDNKRGLSVIHFIQCAENTTWKAAKSKWYRLTKNDATHKDEITHNVFMIVLAKCGKNQNYMTPGMNFIGLYKLMFFLGGKVGLEFRRSVESIHLRVISGDLSILDEIRTNAASNAPVQQLCRQALTQDPARNASASVIEELDTESEVDEPSRIDTEIAKVLCSISEKTVVERECSLNVARAKRKLESDEDLQFQQMKLSLREKEFALEHKQKYADQEIQIELQQKEIETDKMKKLAAYDLRQREIELQDLQQQKDIELDLKKKLAEIELQQKKKHAPQYGQLALQERDIKLREKKIALHEKQIELRERELKLSIQIKQNNLVQNKTPPATTKQPPPSSKDKTPLTTTKQPPPPSKDKTHAAGETNKQPPPRTKNAPSTKKTTKQSLLRAKDNTKQSSSVLNVTGQLVIPFLTSSISRAQPH